MDIRWIKLEHITHGYVGNTVIVIAVELSNNHYLVDFNVQSFIAVEWSENFQPLDVTVDMR